MAGRGNPAWKKGVSGNPEGRPKVVNEVRDLARAHTEDAMRALVDICVSGTTEAARVSAANAILDRGYGKPTQPILTKSLDSMTETEVVNFLGYSPSPDELIAIISTIKSIDAAGNA